MIEFKGSHFERDVILWGVHWYVAYPISYRQLEEMMEERGVEVDHSTLNRWVVFAEHGKTFDLPLAPDGTDFQKRVLARARDDPVRRNAFLWRDRRDDRRAAGVARGRRGELGRNAMPVIVPCHRVHRRRRKPYRFWRRHGAQALPVGF